MKKLQQLIQEDSLGFLYKDKKWLTEGELNRVLRVGKPVPIVVESPCLDITCILDELAERNSALIPEGATAYVASDFHPDTQHLREGKAYSVYAVQFYRLLW